MLSCLSQSVLFPHHVSTRWDHLPVSFWKLLLMYFVAFQFFFLFIPWIPSLAAFCLKKGLCWPNTASQSLAFGSHICSLGAFMSTCFLLGGRKQIQIQKIYNKIYKMLPRGCYFLFIYFCLSCSREKNTSMPLNHQRGKMTPGKSNFASIRRPGYLTSC